MFECVCVYMSICVYMYICIYVYMYLWIYIYMSIYIHIYICIYLYIYPCTYIHSDLRGMEKEIGVRRIELVATLALPLAVIGSNFNAEYERSTRLLRVVTYYFTTLLVPYNFTSKVVWKVQVKLYCSTSKVVF